MTNEHMVVKMTTVLALLSLNDNWSNFDLLKDNLETAINELLTKKELKDMLDILNDNELLIWNDCKDSVMITSRGVKRLIAVTEAFGRLYKDEHRACLQ